MSRQLRRVPLDFNWPRNKIWEGFVNPHCGARAKCPPCEGSGYSPAGKIFHDQWYGYGDFDPVAYGAKPLTIAHPAIKAFARRNIEHGPDFYLQFHDADTQRHVSREGRLKFAMERETERLFSLWRSMWSHQLTQADVDALVAADRLWDFTRVAITPEQKAVVKERMAAGENSWLPFDNGYMPTADEINTWSMSGIGHDGINSGVCLRARCEREGVPLLCPLCKGDGALWTSPEAQTKYETWKPTEPPAGDGYQLWENTSKGSPQSPVFATLNELCAWCEYGATTFADKRATIAEWKKMLEEDNVHHREGNAVFIYKRALIAITKNACAKWKKALGW